MHNQPREPQPYEDCQAKSIQEFGWTSQGMDWGWVKASRATTHRRVKEFGYSCRIPLVKPLWTTDNVRGILPGLRRRRTGLLPSGPKFSFQMRAKFCISFRNQGPRVGGRGGEAHSPSCMKSSVKFPQSVMIWGCNVICWCWSLVFFWKPTSLHPFTKKFWSTACFLLLTSFFKDADFIFQQDLAPAHTAKRKPKLVNDHGVGVLDWPANSPDLNPIENLWGIVKRKMRTRDPENADELRPLSKNLGFHTTSAVPQNWSPPCHAELRQ